MRLGRILIEDEEVDNRVDEFAEILANEVVNVGNGLLYRGVPRDIEAFERVRVPLKRNSKDTPDWINSMIEGVARGDGHVDNGYLIRTDMVTFATPNHGIATSYGKGRSYYAFYPEGVIEGINYSKVDGFSYFDTIKNAVRAMSDRLETIHYHYDASVAREFTKLGLTTELTDVYKIYDFMAKVTNLDYLREIYDGVRRINDTLDKDMVSNFEAVNKMFVSFLFWFNDLIRAIENYFKDVTPVKLPLGPEGWVRGIDGILLYEYIIKVPYYYIVNTSWFLDNFIYDQKLNGYRKK